MNKKLANRGVLHQDVFLMHRVYTLPRLASFLEPQFQQLLCRYHCYRNLETCGDRRIHSIGFSRDYTSVTRLPALASRVTHIHTYVQYQPWKNMYLITVVIASKVPPNVWPDRQQERSSLTIDWLVRVPSDLVLSGVIHVGNFLTTSPH